MADIIDYEDDDYDDDPAPVRARRGYVEPAEPRRRWPKVVAIVLGVLLLVGAAIAGFYVFTLNSALGQVKRNTSMMPTSTAVRPSAATPAPEAAKKPLTFVLMGTDAADGGPPRSDSLMVAYLPSDRQHLYLVSFTRDMWVEIPGHGERKINAAYALGGPALTIETLESLLNVRMDHAASIDFDGFIHLTTLLGGVTVYNEYESQTNEFYFPKGEITISGEQALIYVRERKNLPEGDLSRAKRQRDVVTAIIKKATSAEVIANPFKLNEFISAASVVVQVDPGLTNGVVYRTASELKFTDDSIRSLQAPILGFGTSWDGQSINLVDWEGLNELAKAMQTDTMEEYYAAHPPQ